MIGEQIIINAPKRLKGQRAEICGDRFKYPGQSFWVFPVILLPSGKKALVLNYTSVIDEITVKIDPKIVYDYQDLLNNAKCPSCNHSLNWILSNEDSIKGHEMSDKFCFAECCGMQYGMVPEKVRILSVPVASIQLKEFSEQFALDDK